MTGAGEKPGSSRAACAAYSRAWPLRGPAPCASRLAAEAASSAARARSALIGETTLRSSALCTSSSAAAQSPPSNRFSSSARQAQREVRASP
jgi:hypothetical protein